MNPLLLLYQGIEALLAGMSRLPLDVIAGGLCFAMALCLFLMHEVSREDSPTVPPITRGLKFWWVAAGVMLVWRGADFLRLDGAPDPIGHINAVGVLTQLPMFAMYLTSAVYVWQTRRPLVTAEGIERVLSETLDPQAVPLTMTREEIVAAARARGMIVYDDGDAPPGAAVISFRR